MNTNEPTLLSSYFEDEADTVCPPDDFYQDEPEFDIEKSNLYRHAVDELKLGGYYDGDEMNHMMADNVLELITTFAKQGHSGFSAYFCIDVFSTLAKYELLTPLTDEDDEWVDVAMESMKDGNGTIYQNKRCSAVFKVNKDGVPYYLDAIVFKDKDGCTYTSSKSQRNIKFPYIPKTEYRKDYGIYPVIYLLKDLLMKWRN